MLKIYHESFVGIFFNCLFDLMRIVVVHYTRARKWNIASIDLCTIVIVPSEVLKKAD